jgi:hypothetical protein
MNRYGLATMYFVIGSSCDIDLMLPWGHSLCEFELLPGRSIICSISWACILSSTHIGKLIYYSRSQHVFDIWPGFDYHKHNIFKDSKQPRRHGHVKFPPGPLYLMSSTLYIVNDDNQPLFSILETFIRTRHVLYPLTYNVSSHKGKGRSLYRHSKHENSQSRPTY